MPGYEPKIVGYLCTWCSYTGADLAGTARLKYPSNLRAVRVPCSGRVSPEIIMRTFDQGADGVLVLGCHIGECHYDTGNHRAAKRMPILRVLMEMAGLEPERLRLDWVSASEGERFARIVDEFTEGVRALGPARWRDTGAVGGRRSFAVPAPAGAVRAPALDAPEMAAAIQAKARELLAGGEVACVIGYEVGPRGRTRPAFVRRPDDAARLTWNQACTHNLTVYLSDTIMPPAAKRGTPPQRVAVVAKPCDSRAINVLLAESQFARDQVHVIGVACPGIFEGAGSAPVDAGPLQARCERCSERVPVVYDTLVGQAPAVPDIAERSGPSLRSGQALDWVDALPPAERLEFWLSQFDRCIRCYACRQACPMCNCPTCLYERDDSLWAGLGIRVNEKRTFHLGRAYHLAGRCIGCDECERVCPMNIPIGLLNRKLVEAVQDTLHYRAGVAPVPSPFVTVLGGEEG